MKILTVCEQGNNRSVTFATLLRYKYKCDTIPMGFDTMSAESQVMLYNWADVIIITDKNLVECLPKEYKQKMKLWDVGPDHYIRPFNRNLHQLASKIIEENPL